MPAVQLQGFFDRAPWQGTVTIRIGENGKIRQVDGVLPGTCRDKRTGSMARSGRDGAIGLQFVVYPDAPVRANGSFAFTAKGGGEDIAPHTITVRGTFYGNNVIGRVKGRGGTTEYDRYAKCSGDQPFWAKRLE